MPRFTISLVLLMFAGSAQAASFDCTKAVTPDERAVCRTRALNDRDVRMATLYTLDRRFVPMGMRDRIIEDQGIWLARRRSCRADIARLTTAYDRRIAELQAIIDTRVYPHGPF